MSYSLLVCEIGPVFDFVRSSRKTKDYWAASFLFSYLMGHVAKTVKERGGRIIRPDLEDDPIVNETGRKGGARAGSIPDQIFVVVKEEQKKKLNDELNGSFDKGVAEILDQVIEGAKIGVDKHKAGEQTASYFNFFYIFHEIDGAYPTYKEFLDAEQKIIMRGKFRQFNQTNDKSSSVQKWDRCDLCGERDKVCELNRDASERFYKKERVCGVCLLKRFLYKAQEIEKIAIEPRYDSTSDIAAVPVMNAVFRLREFPALKALQENFYTVLVQAKEKAKSSIDVEAFRNRPLGHPVYGRLLWSEQGKDVRNKFDAIEETKEELNDSYVRTTWLNRPYYAVVYMDGDNMGSAFRGNDDYFKNVSEIVSSVLSKFTRRAEEIVETHSGQLIYAGGDDVNFMIHPEHLIDCVRDLTREYKEQFRRRLERHGETLPQEIKNKIERLSLSAGVVVCPHKYPLSEAIKRSYQALSHNAKGVPGKDATAIHLIKGHTDAVTFAIPNRLLETLTLLKRTFEDGEISRTTAHRFGDERNLHEMLLTNDPAAWRNYLITVLKATRGRERGAQDIEEHADLILKCGDIEGLTPKEKIATILDVLLYIRFLTGDREI
jgi:CRISPR-associated protein Cmr2